jgi:hypothetical protein
MHQRHFLHVGDDPARKHEVELTQEDIRTMDLVPCGGFDSGEIHETYGVFRGHPAGDRDYQPSREPPQDDFDVPF